MKLSDIGKSVLALCAATGLLLTSSALRAEDVPDAAAAHKHSVKRRKPKHEAESPVPKKAASVVLYTNPATGEVFTRPGKGRVRLVLPYQRELDQRIEKAQERIEDNARRTIKQELSRSQDELRTTNASLAHEVQTMQPAWREYTDKFFKKLKIGTLFYADWAMYTHTGFGPQFLTQLNPPGPGNNYFNSFDVTRTYINLIYTPDENWSFRLTPNIYRTAGNAVSGSPNSKSSAIGSNLNGELGLRLKYAYLDYNKPFSFSDSLREDKLTIGQLPNPLVAWEEDLYGFRYVNLVPWNFLSLSSTQTGAAIHGPVKFGERQYADYDLGVYTNASFRAQELTNTKQGMARITLYPFGATSRFDGLGLTGFYDYGYSNRAPDQTAAAGGISGSGLNGSLYRLAALVHYTKETWGLGAEYDQGRNSFGSGNFFSANGPLDEFGAGATPFAGFDALTKALLNNGSARQQGWDVFGHVQLPNTPFTLFGMFEQFLPNTKANQNPLDFYRWVAGLEYKYSKNLRFALDSQNLLFYHGQSPFSAAEANNFKAGSLAAPVANPVPRDTHAFMINVEFSY